MKERTSTPLETEADFFRWALQYSLNDVIQFHNAIRALLKEKYGESAGDRIVQSKLKHYDKMNSANSLVVILAYLEEMLTLFWRREWPDREIPRRKDLLDELGLPPNKLTCWSILQDAYKIRNCLLHANGHISLMKNSGGIRACIKRHRDGLKQSLGRVVATPVFLQRCVDAVGELKDEMLKAKEKRAGKESR